MIVNNCSMTVNYCGILTLEIIGFFTTVIYHGILPWYFYNISPLVSMLQKIFPSSLMMRPNKLEGLSFNTFSSQVFEFEGKARANPIGGPFRCFLLG